MMPDLANSPRFSSIARECASLYTSGRILLDKDTLVIFTCGAEDNEGSARSRFLDYAKRCFKHGTFFRAEDAFPVLLKSRRDDLLSIEHRLADYSDCVLILNESPGTLAELGAFATNAKVVRKILLVNPREHLGKSSFINLGPIAKVDKKSRFKKTIHVEMRTISIHFDTILKRIEKHALRRRRLGVDFSQPGIWDRIEGKLRLLFLQDIINLFCPVTHDELLTTMKRLFPDQFVKFDIELGLLTATKRVLEREQRLITSTFSIDHNYNIDKSLWFGLRKRVIDLYRSRDKSRLSLLHMRAGELL